MLPAPHDRSTPAATLAARVAYAWQVLCTDARQLHLAVPWLAELHASDPDVHAYAAMFDARARLSEGDRAGCEAALTRAEGLFAQGVDPDGALCCLDVRSMLLIRDGDYPQAMALLQPALEAIAQRPPSVLHYFLLKRRAAVLEGQGQFDDALRAHHLAIGAARQAEHPGALAHGLAALGGVHVSLLNHVDALPLCEEAWALCESEPGYGLVGVAGPNLMMARSGSGRHAEAAALADRLRSVDHHLPVVQGDRRHFMYAIVFARAGRPVEAQDCLDQGRALQPPSAQPRAEWVWAQADLWNRQRRFDEARALVVGYLADGPDATHGPDFPVDLANLHGQAALACEGLGRLEDALRHERLAAAAREQAQVRASHAQRLSLQIGMELEAAHRQRDDALRKQHELAELNARLHAANQAKSRFLAAASHDLRQPVHALALQTATLRMALDQPRQFEVLAGIERSNEALGTMFDALLDLSRIDAGALQAQPRPFDLDPLLLRLVEEMWPLAEAKGLRLALRVAGGHLAGTRSAHSDPTLLEAMLRNLVGNAIKYTQRGAVLLTVRAGQQGGVWRLQIWDTGIGIGAADQARVFDEFYQVGNPARRRDQGMGLGLSIVDRLARLLAHGLSLRSVPGRGTCVELDVPVAALSPRRVEEGASQGVSLGLHLAVIEDDPEVQASMRGLLQAWGCRVSLGQDADEVLQAWNQQGPPPDAVLADLRLPGPRHGAQEVSRLREALRSPLPALVLTGDVAPDTLALLAAQQLPWLAKPAPVERLLHWLLGVVPRQDSADGS